LEDWLRLHGLANRIAAFVEAGITKDQLGTLTEPDLRELGLTIGERKRFLKAVAETFPPPAQPPAEQAAPPPDIARLTRGERRPLTVMFIDLVNSSALGEQLDPEDLMDLIRDYRAFCGGPIARYGGHIARFVGDGILAYFCYPIANENDPERAVRAALEITQGIGAVPSAAGVPLAARIGLATGRVIVSDLFSGNEAETAAVIGSTPNLAARLQSLAGPNQIVIAEQTHARIRQHFACEQMGSVELRGFDQPHRPWRVLARQPASSTAAERAPARLTALKGREGELAVLRAEWRRAQQADGRVVLVLGEPGIGKSRLVEEMVSRHLPETARLVRLAALAFDEDSPLRPVADHIRARAALEADDTPETARAKLEAVVAGGEDERRQALPVIALLAGLPADDAAAEALTPDRLRERTIAVLTQQLLLRAEAQPLCLVVEDLHWLDPTSREMLDRVVARVAGQRILLLLTARDGFQADWTDSRAATVLQLERLSEEDVASMLHELFGAEPVPAALLHQVAVKTDGVPLFVEEVARTLLDRQGTTGWDEVRAGDAAQEIPDSLHESLMARLDRSGTAKEVAQAAAVAGRSVRRDVLAAACGRPPAELDSPLETLVRLGVLERHNAQGRESYTFGHALLRDAAYGTLLRERRRDLHERVARALQAFDPAGMMRNPEVLALHLTEAGLAEEAAPHWLEAARHNLSRSALTEATRMLRRALTALDAAAAAPDAPARLQVTALLGAALIGLRGPNGAETRQHYTRAVELCRRQPESPLHFPIYWGWWRLNPSSIERATLLLDRAVTGGDPGLMLQAHHCNWCSHLNSGSFALCCEHIDRGLAIYDQGDYRDHARSYGNHDPKVCALGARAQAYWMQGRLRSAMQDEIAALDWAEQLDHLGSRVHAMGLTLLHRVYRRDYQVVFDRSATLMAFTAEHGIADHASAGRIFQGWVIATQHDPAAGLRMLEDGLARQTETATNEDYSVYLCLLAEALMAAGHADRGVERLSRERPIFDTSDLRIWLPELIRVTGETVLAADPGATERARALFAEAEALAASQGVPMLGLRVAASIARTERQAGGNQSAAARLRAALAAVPEDDGSADLVAARLLLQEVSSETIGCVR
jgi:class 3 adenylate cyclase/predicted ATPase